MAYSEDARKYSESVLEQRREINSQISVRKRAEIVDKCKGFTELETYRRDLNLKKLRASLMNDSSKIDSLNVELQSISKEIENLLNRYGYSLEDLEEKYTCKFCNDTGILKDGSLCKCKIELMTSFELAKVQSVSPLSLSSFDTFDLSYYSSEKKNGISSYEVMKENLKKCKEFCYTFPTSENLLLMGRTGIGKTHLALSVANEILKKGYEVIYCSCSNILQIIDAERSENKFSDTLNSIKRCDLLILDDLGSEYINSYFNAILYDIINSRLSEKKASIITTNIDDTSKIQVRYGDKVTSRIIGCYEILPCLGEDLRMRNI
ncbi:MAG: ATP-binding protein [Oscillospiraceae bacterium]|nr:ATP-binding protein [Oscillospiraceae bacterium]